MTLPVNKPSMPRPKNIVNRPDVDITIPQSMAYAAPIPGMYFFYVPMWSILPGVYGKYFGLSLTSISAVVLFIRLFDGIIDTTIGYVSDRHRATGGSRKSWVVIGSLGSLVACYFLFKPPNPVTTSYYLGWSLAYFLALTVSDIPHLTWGSELTMDYQRRARVFSVRSILSNVGNIVFYTLPLLPIYASNDFTPQFLQDSTYVGAAMVMAGVIWMLLDAPAGMPTRIVHGDSLRAFLQCIYRNKPLLLYICAFGCEGLCYGMWFGLQYIYVESYLELGNKVAVMLLIGTAVATVSTPLWLKIIRRSSKSSAWAMGISIFIVQLLGTLLISPQSNWWIECFLIVLANICFSCRDVAGLAILGDVADYGKLKFQRDRGATYFGLNTLIFKFGLGVGGGLSLGIAGLFGFSPSETTHSSEAVFGLKLGFVVLPICFALGALLFILRTPLNPRRHRIIKRRIERRLSANDGVQSGARLEAPPVRAVASTQID
jgi:glycoside/pentoside/hexuronide:cation symporter, GPH family